MRLLIGFRKPFAALEEALAEAGCEFLRWVPGEPPPAALQADAALVDVCDLARNLVSGWRLRRILRRFSTPVIGLDRDAPWHKGVRARRLLLLRALHLLDVYASHSLQDATHFAREAIYLPNAAWTNRYHLGVQTLQSLREASRYRYDVTFIGNVNAQRYREHAERVKYLDALRERLAVAGIALQVFDGDTVTPAAQIELIQASRINLNYGAAADHGSLRSWGLPERCYGIPACGGFLLSDERRHARDDFIPGAEWVSFGTLDDCVGKIVHYLAHFGQARDIAEAAHRRVLRDHTYRQRAQQLMAHVERCHGSRYERANARGNR
jgi:spore maturation protein CgeB